MQHKRRNKIGRNEKCPCNSGIKYKHCHGKSKEGLLLPEEVVKHVDKLKALDIQRRLQQGLGNPIISTEHNGHRIVVVANEVYSGKWKTFHDFLCEYIKHAMGSDWGNKELKKPYEDRHPLIKIYKMICDYQKTFLTTPDNIHSAPFTGAVSAYMW